MTPVADAPGLRTRLAHNRGRQRELYGAPLGDRLRRLTAQLGISQGRLAQTLGVSPAMLSQLASARRVKIGDPAVLARLQLLDHRCAAGPPRGPGAVDALLTEVAGAQLRWTGADVPDATRVDEPGVGRPDPRQAERDGPLAARTPADALRTLAPPARLAAAAAALTPGFPELADVLRAAVARPRTDRSRAVG
jgi:hypothetical protein